MKTLVSLSKHDTDTENKICFLGSPKILWHTDILNSIQLKNV